MRSAEQIFLTTGLLRRFCMGGGWIPLVVRLVTDLDFSAAQLLLMGVAIESAIVLGEIPTGVFADTVSRKWSVVAGAFLLGGAQFVSGIIDEFTLFLVTQFFWGIGWTLISGAEIAWVTEEVGSAEEVEPVVLRRARLQFVALFAGLLIFPFVGWAISLQFAVLLAGGISMAWAAALAVLMTESQFTPSTESHWRSFKTNLRDGAGFVWSMPGLRILGFALVCAGFGAEAIDRNDLRRLEDLGLSTAGSAILIFTVISLARSLLSAFVLWRWEDRFAGRRVVTGMATLFLLVGVCVAVVAHAPVLVVAGVALVGHGSMLNISEPLMTTWTNAMAPAATRATVHSFIGQTRALGEIGGGLGLGAVAAGFTLPTALTISAGLFVLAAAVTLKARPYV